MRDDSPDPLIAIQTRVDFVTVTTLDPDGFPDSRVHFNLRKLRDTAFAPPGFLGNPFGTYLGTNTSSSKVGQIRKDPRACLYYCDERTFEGLTVKGFLEEVLDPGIKDALWDPSWDMYYPGGKDGGDYTILRFLPIHAKYYHAYRTVERDCR